MDFYTLLRMFRQFDQPAKRCIVYAGADHSTDLADLLVETQGYCVLQKTDYSEQLNTLEADVAKKSQELANWDDFTRWGEQEMKEQLIRTLDTTRQKLQAVKIECRDVAL